MDIPGLSMALSSSKLGQEVGVKMLKTSMDMMDHAGEAIAGMIESAPAPALNPPHLGNSIDISV